MILMAIFSMALIFGMPKLLENSRSTQLTPATSGHLHMHHSGP